MSDTTHDNLSIDAERDEGASPLELFKRVHCLLRGRYVLALVLGALGASLGAVAGYTSQQPLYMSEGKIHVRPMLGKILDETEMSSMMPMFRNYVNTQAALVKSQRVIDRAMQSSAWRDLGRGASPGEKLGFERSLSVDVDNQSGQIIDVAFIDADPNAAMVGLREVIRSYRDIHAEEERLDDPQRVNVLRERQRVLQNEVDRRTSTIQSIGEEFGTVDLSERLEHDQQYLFELESTLRQLQIELERVQTRQELNGDQKLTIADDMDVAQIAEVDQYMADLLAQRRGYEGQVERLRASGIGPRHRDMKRALADLDAIDVQIGSYKQQWMASHGGDGALKLSVGASTDPQQISAQIKLVSGKLEEWRVQTNDVVKKNQRILQLQADNERDRAELVRVVDRLEQIELESKIQQFEGLSGRISILSEGEMPTAPAIDRRVKLAGAGFVMGGGTPVALIMLFGLLSGRYRYSDEAKGQIRAPLLGILPKLPDNLTDPEQTSVAAHCVHQIRTLLQLAVTEDRTPVFAVTSPTAGDGKTSLALSLGFSFASSGAKTLLIDFDMIGGGMSSALKRKDGAGLFEALDAGTLSGCAQPLWVDRLTLLPVGRHDAEQVGRLSPKAVKKIIEEARRDYDVVVADTGPILGSLEASMLGPEADGVVLVLGRGQSHANADRAFEQLTAVHAKVLGIVFNRAKDADFKRSMSSASIRSVPADGRETDVLKLDPEHARQLDGLGPMPRTIAASVGRVA